MTPLCTQLTLPLEQYIRCCGYEAEITASKRKDSQKEVQNDLRLLCATQIGWDDDGAVRIQKPSHAVGLVCSAPLIIDDTAVQGHGASQTVREQRFAAQLHQLQRIPHI